MPFLAFILRVNKQKSDLYYGQKWNHDQFRFLTLLICLRPRTPMNIEDPKNAMSFVQPSNLSRETKLKVQAMKMLARWLLAIKGMSGARQSGGDMGL